MLRFYRVARSSGWNGAVAALVFFSWGCSKHVVGPAPTLPDGVLPPSPNVVCQDQLTTPVQIYGNDFSPVPVDVPNQPRAVLPDMTLTLVNGLDGSPGSGAAFLFSGNADQPTNMELSSWQSSEQMTLTVNQQVTLDDGSIGELPVGIYDLQVKNPDGNIAQYPGALALVSPPSVAPPPVPGITCLAQGPQQLTINGSMLLDIAGQSPTLEVAGVTKPFAVPAGGLGSCKDVSGSEFATQYCSSATLTLDQDSIPVGYPALVVRNPQTAACASQETLHLRVVPPPSIVRVDDPIECVAQEARTLAIHGSDFLEIDGALPSVTLAGQAFTPTVQDADCQALETMGHTVRSCNTLSISVPQGALPAGTPELVITNPGSANCEASDSTLLRIVDPPAITSASPSAACVALTTQQVTVTGAGFLRNATDSFAVTVAGVAATPTNVTGCTALDGAGSGYESCTGFTVNLNPSALGAGPVAIAVTNPTPPGCGSTSSAVFQVAPPPTLTSVTPIAACAGDALSVALTGTGFVSNMQVFFHGTSSEVAATSVTVTSATQATATLAAPGLPVGTYGVRVDNGSTCTSTLPNALQINQPPIVFFVTPPALYNQTSIDATVFTTGLSSNAQSVKLVDGSGNATNLTFSNDPGKPNRIVATIPSGLAPGSYEMRVTSDIGCVGGLPDSVQVADTLSLALRSPTPIDPSFVSPTTATAVTIFADGAGAGFADGAIAYVDNAGSTDAGAGSSTAQQLRALVVDTDPHQLSAVIPGGLSPGQYNLIVINPTGEVGFVANAVTVTSGEPPVISSVQPVSATNNANAPGTIFGTNFDPNGVTVNLRCTAPGGGATTTLPATVGSVTSTQASVTLPVSGVTAGSVCLVDLTNTAQGGTSTFSAISVRNPAANLGTWTAAANNMVEGRRALGLVAARPTNTSRFLYAIGGDDSNGTVSQTVEAASSGVLGALGTWSLQRNSLPAARTAAGFAQLGRFIYLTGGKDSTDATNTTFRAQVLDPLATPAVSDLSADLGDGTHGLGTGLWHYRVSALFPGSDASNANGESLPGEPLSVRLPNITQGVILTLKWDTIPNATAYRIYRTPVVGDTVAQVEGLADVTCDGNTVPCTYTDDGQTATQPAQTPLPQGSLGVWHSVGTGMGTPREGHVSVIAPKPGSSTDFFLYSLGGRTTGGTLQSDYEFATISVAVDGSQTVSAWTSGVRDIGTAKADLAAWVITANDTSLIASTDAYVFVGTGHTGAATDTGEVRSGIVTSSGQLIDSTAGSLDLENAANTGVGYAYAHGAGFLYVFGGERANSGGTLGTDSSSQLATGPDLGNWNSLGGGSLVTRRSFSACAQESAFYYVAGGHTGGSATTALKSVEQTTQ